MIRAFQGFTLIELLISVAIIVLLIGAAIPLYSNLQGSAQLNESIDQLLLTVRLARSLSVERKNDSSFGVYLDTNPNGADRFILFQGPSYAARAASYDRVTSLDRTLALSAALTNSAAEIVFSRAVGVPSVTGTLTIAHTASGTRTVSINSAGMVQHQ